MHEAPGSALTYGERAKRTPGGMVKELLVIPIAAECTRVENWKPTEERS